MGGQELDQQAEISRTGTGERISIAEFRERVDPCKDVFHHVVQLNAGDGERELRAILYYCDGMIDGQMFQLGLLPMLENWKSHTSKAWIGSDIRGETGSKETGEGNVGEEDRGRRHPSDLFNRMDGVEEHLFERLFAGSVIIVFSDRESFYEFNIASQPARSPEESTMELSLKGPRDGFVEKLSVNVALVRKRMRTPNMHVEYFIIGTESRTEVALIYMADQARPELVEEARRRLQSVHISSLKGAGELEERIGDRRNSLFPLMDYVGRPDFVVQSIMKGRIAVLTDGTPAALIAPGNLTLLVKSPEDAHLPFYYVTLERLLRFLGLFTSMFLPGFWVSLCSFNTDQIPFTLLATVTMSRIGLPISATMEMFLMLGMFELFREAGVRLPRPVGQTVSVVGGLIIGDAAIRAGMTSPTMLVVAAVSAVSTFTLVNQSLAGSVSIIRFFVLILSSIFGMYGYFVGMFAVILYMCSLESFGQPYMEPLAPLHLKDVAAALIQKPWHMYRSRRQRP
ncbi:spore germination protein [Paenibacillus sp. LHD-117]|uniref:spore germination protein n=1 Tax=Paenibacillus sp. LHD-117 TaxID=3071412 RepID=UPI0027DEB9A2|nr:spore germination protein [Paenibacillus sp. LHD-117]MDQ6423003.1 spore germination protein [Paenibacillus sp. LHD-117]